MLLTLSNDEIEFVVDTVGADQRSLRFVDEDLDYFGAWRAPEDYRAGVCFPLLGNVPDGRYAWNSSEYEMPRHGFARETEFAVIELSDSRVVLETSDTEITRRMFPFAFRLQVAYSLSGRTLRSEYRVTAAGDAALRYSVGAHPFFSCPVDDEEGLSLNDFVVEFTFPAGGVARSYGSKEDIAAAFFADGRRLHLHEELFREGAFCLNSSPAQCIRLRSTRDNRSVELDLGSAPYLQLWSVPGEPFVCLEPWFGAISSRPFADVDGDWARRPGTYALSSGESRAHHFDITIQR